MAYRYNTDEERLRAVYDHHLRQVELHQKAAADAARQFRELTGTEIQASDLLDEAVSRNTQ